MKTDDEQISFLERRVTFAFEKRIVTIASGDSLLCEGGEWRDEIVVVERGEIKIETPPGDRHTFRRGSVLTLDGLRLEALHNEGSEDVILVAVSRNPEKNRNSSRQTD